MTRLSSLILLSAGALALSSPAFAGKASVNTGEKLCKSELAKQDPAPKSVRVDKDNTKADNAFFVFSLRVKQADDSSTKVLCTVDRETSAVTLAAAD
jgi:hypothetical protein